MCVCVCVCVFIYPEEPFGETLLDSLLAMS